MNAHSRETCYRQRDAFYECLDRGAFPVIETLNLMVMIMASPQNMTCNCDVCDDIGGTSESCAEIRALYQTSCLASWVSRNDHKSRRGLNPQQSSNPRPDLLCIDIDINACEFAPAALFCLPDVVAICHWVIFC